MKADCPYCKHTATDVRDTRLITCDLCCGTYYPQSPQSKVLGKMLLAEEGRSRDLLRIGYIAGLCEKVSLGISKASIVCYEASIKSRWHEPAKQVADAYGLMIIEKDRETWMVHPDFFAWCLQVAQLDSEDPEAMRLRGLCCGIPHEQIKTEHYMYSTPVEPPP